ncbi:MAG TPA: hypothetical protein VGM54_12715 [Chthoniobacter sp.]|jgi:hypothetical protein
MNKRYTMRRGGPDVLTEELVNVFSSRGDIEFKPLFDLVYARLQGRKAAHGGEEMLRLRAYEKLHWLVRMGGVVKTGKLYRGNSGKLRPLVDRVATSHCQELLDTVRTTVPK